MTAPHLPPKSCHLETHRRMQTLPWLLGVIFLSVIAGGSAAIMAAAWLVPTFLQDTSIYIRNRGVSEPLKNENMDTVLEHQLEQRSVTIFDTHQAIAPNIYGDEAIMGTLALLSSDGWGVMYLAGYQSGQEKFWQVIDDKGVVLTIEKIVYDQDTQLVYVKLRGNGFQVFSFMEWKTVEPNLPVWVWQGGRWQKKYLEYPERTIVNTVHAPEMNALSYFLIPRQTDRSMVVNEQGQLVGFIAKEGRIVPNYYLMAELPHILTGSAVKNTKIPISGIFISHYLLDGQVELVTGFYISAIHSAMAKKSIQIGDIILRVNGQSATSAALPELLAVSSDEVIFDIWRKGVVVSNVSIKKELFPL